MPAQYYLKRNHRLNGEEASFYEEATDCSKLALEVRRREAPL